MMTPKSPPRASGFSEVFALIDMVNAPKQFEKRLNALQEAQEAAEGAYKELTDRIRAIEEHERVHAQRVREVDAQEETNRKNAETINKASAELTQRQEEFQKSAKQTQAELRQRETEVGMARQEADELRSTLAEREKTLDRRQGDLDRREDAVVKREQDVEARMAKLRELAG